MSEDGKKTLGVMGGPRSANVKQSFSHGRNKNVVVETKRKRVVVPKPGAAKPAAPGAVRGGDPARRPAGISDVEMDRRLKAVQTAKARETEDNKRCPLNTSDDADELPCVDLGGRRSNEQTNINQPQTHTIT